MDAKFYSAEFLSVSLYSSFLMLFMEWKSSTLNMELFRVNYGIFRVRSSAQKGVRVVQLLTAGIPDFLSCNGE